VRKAVVIAKLGDGMSDKSAAYIDARFDILAEDAAKGDPVADALKGKKQEKVTSLDKAYKTRNTDLSNAWMGAQKKEA